MDATLIQVLSQSCSNKQKILTSHNKVRVTKYDKCCNEQGRIKKKVYMYLQHQNFTSFYSVFEQAKLSEVELPFNIKFGVLTDMFLVSARLFGQK